MKPPAKPKGGNGARGAAAANLLPKAVNPFDTLNININKIRGGDGSGENEKKGVVLSQPNETKKRSRLQQEVEDVEVSGMQVFNDMRGRKRRTTEQKILDELVERRKQANERIKIVEKRLVVSRQELAGPVTRENWQMRRPWLDSIKRDEEKLLKVRVELRDLESNDCIEKTSVVMRLGKKELTQQRESGLEPDLCKCKRRLLHFQHEHRQTCSHPECGATNRFLAATKSTTSYGNISFTSFCLPVVSVRMLT